jgi:hydroxymethylpyrimidine/phosphomethylpyrimidine kinase
MNNSLFCTIPAALTIAGSDPSGGAGIQADLATFAATGVYGMAVITALTSQNPGQVTRVQAVGPGMVSSQITTLLEGMIPGAVKTGMLANTRIISSVTRTLPPEIPLIVDPVMVSTSGHRLLEESAISIISNTLIPRATLVTPNIPEAEILTGLVIRDEAGMEKAGREILDLGAGAVVIKGGHSSGEYAVDLLITREKTIRFNTIRMPYQVHGSGCCFSAALTGYLALGYDPETACRKGKEMVSRAIRMAIPSVSGIRIVNPGGIKNISEEE